MKYGLLILGITSFFIANTYYDGKYVKLLKSWKKILSNGWYSIYRIISICIYS